MAVCTCRVLYSRVGWYATAPVGVTTWHEYINCNPSQLDVIFVIDVKSPEECRWLCAQDPQPGRCRVATYGNTSRQCSLKACAADIPVTHDANDTAYTYVMVSPYDAKECSE